MKLNRRQFLQSSGAVGLWGVAGCMGFPAITSTRSPNSLLRHMSVGTANMAGGDIASLKTHPKIEMAAFCDVDANFLAKRKAEFPKAHFYTDWREMFEKEGASVDSVNISIPDHNHVICATEALRRGKHIYLQKPMCKTMQEAAFLRNEVRKSGVVTQMGTQYAAFGADRAAVDLMRSQALGPVEKAYFFCTRMGLSRKRRYLPPAEVAPATLNWNLWLGSAAYRPYAPKVYHPLIWRVWHDLGSGWIGDIGCHLISAIWLGMDLGDAAPLDVRAETLVDAEDSVKDLVWPNVSRIVWHFAGVPASGGKPFELEWFDGFTDPDSLSPAKYRPTPELEALWAATPAGKRPHEGKVVKCRDGWILQKHGDKVAYALDLNKKPIPVPNPAPAKTHYHEFVDCCLGDIKKTRSSLDWSIYMREAVITGEIAERVPETLLKWDPKTRTFDNAAANKFLKREYRKGWEIPGLG